MESTLKLAPYIQDPMVELFGNYRVFVSVRGGERKEVLPWKVHVDMHDIREAGVVSFDFSGEIDVAVCCKEQLQTVMLRPLSKHIPLHVEGNEVCFTLQEPGNFSLEINGDRFHNLHIFANPLEHDVPDPEAENVVYVQPGTHLPSDLYQLLKAPGKDTLYFAPGLHQLISKALNIPSGKVVYLAAGAALWAGLNCHRAENVCICGRGSIYLYHEPWRTHRHAIDLFLCRNIKIEGIMCLNPSGHTVGVAECEDVVIDSIKSFSCHGWTDGINFFASKRCQVRGVFMRNSDDCITVYGSRGEYRGDSADILVKDSCLWADVAHPILIGTHGAFDADGNVLERLTFRNLDILNHHELQENYLGCMAVNVGDGNTARDICFEDIRVEDYERGRLIDLRICWNLDYNPVPGKTIENVIFRNITYDGKNDIPSQISGYDETRLVRNILIENLMINGKHVTSFSDGNFKLGAYTENIRFS